MMFTRKRLSALFVLALATGAVLPSPGRNGTQAVSAAAGAPIVQQAAPQGVSAETVLAVQGKLSNYGYVLESDGIQGPRTTKAVTHWQRANGLVADGVIGPETLRSLGIGTTAAAPAAPAPAAPSGGRYTHPNPNVERWHDTALSAGWSEAEWRVVSCIMEDPWTAATGESRGNPNAYNGKRNDRSYGLMQLNTKGYLWDWYKTRVATREALFDPYTNLAVAKQLSNSTASARWAGRDKWYPWRSSAANRKRCFA